MLYQVEPLANSEAGRIVKKCHYLHRKPMISFAFGLFEEFGYPLGVITFGIPASRQILISACRTNPELVIELNRLWVEDKCPRNTESFFIAQALKQFEKALIVVSYADTAYGHKGFVYRAANFYYAGITDMDRKQPRYDYVADDSGRHPRSFSRGNTVSGFAKIRRKPKHRYWITTGNRRERRALAKLVTWPRMKWGEYETA